MCRNRELLDFEADSSTGAVDCVHVLDESCLAQGADAPSFIGSGKKPDSLVHDVQRLLRRRSLSPRRVDLPEILQATGAQNPTELALLSHGCSLSDQYWYRPRGSHERWEDVNFYDNDWDPAFGNAVLSRNWGALAQASMETPDITCGGYTRKAWVSEEGQIRLLKASPVGSVAYIEGELIATKMVSRIMKPSEFTRYEKVRRFGEDFTSCNLMLGPAEEHVSADALLGPEGWRLYGNAGAQSANVIRRFAQVLEERGVEGALQYAARISVVSTLALTHDQHLLNFGAIRNVETGAYRTAPVFDYGGAFGMGLSLEEMERLCAKPVLIAIIIARMFNELEPEWDYSWYDPHALDGFAEELEDALTAVDGLYADFPRIVRQAFSAQLTYVNRVARG